MFYIIVLSVYQKLAKKYHERNIFTLKINTDVFKIQAITRVCPSKQNIMENLGIKKIVKHNNDWYILFSASMNMQQAFTCATLLLAVSI